MELERCPACVAVAHVATTPYGPRIVCGVSQCGTAGPFNDPDGAKWNAMCRGLQDKPKTMGDCLLSHANSELRAEIERLNTGILIDHAHMQEQVKDLARYRVEIERLKQPEQTTAMRIGNAQEWCRRNPGQEIQNDTYPNRRRRFKNGHFQYKIEAGGDWQIERSDIEPNNTWHVVVEEQVVEGCDFIEAYGGNRPYRRKGDDKWIIPKGDSVLVSPSYVKSNFEILVQGKP